MAAVLHMLIGTAGKCLEEKHSQSENWTSLFLGNTFLDPKNEEFEKLLECLQSLAKSTIEPHNAIISTEKNIHLESSIEG